MKKNIQLLICCGLAINSLFSQNIAINTTSNPANSSAMLDVGTALSAGAGVDTKGMLIPRVALSATNNTSPISPVPGATEKGLIVFNTATAGASLYSVSQK